jgi:carbohydrate-selective porin OprB
LGGSKAALEVRGGGYVRAEDGVEGWDGAAAPRGKGAGGEVAEKTAQLVRLARRRRWR